MYVGPDIVQDGLVAVFDAGSTRSYPGTGSTWYNLIGTVNGTLSDTSIGTTTAGVMTFDGVDTTITIPLASLSSTDFTVIGVTQRTNAAAGRLIAGRLNNWLLGQWDVYMRQYFSQGWVTGSGPLTDDLQTHIWCGTGDISIQQGAIPRMRLGVPDFYAVDDSGERNASDGARHRTPNDQEAFADPLTYF